MLGKLDELRVTQSEGRSLRQEELEPRKLGVVESMVKVFEIDRPVGEETRDELRVVDEEALFESLGCQGRSKIRGIIYLSAEQESKTRETCRATECTRKVPKSTFT